MSCRFNFDTTKIHHGPSKSLEDIPWMDSRFGLYAIDFV